MAHYSDDSCDNVFCLHVFHCFDLLGETWFAASDLGWVVGHSYIAYGPLMAGNTSILYEVCPQQTHISIYMHSMVANFVANYMLQSVFCLSAVIALFRESLSTHPMPAPTTASCQITRLLACSRRPLLCARLEERYVVHHLLMSVWCGGCFVW